LEVDLYLRRITLHADCAATDLETSPGKFGRDIFRAQLADFVNAIRTGQPPTVDGLEGRRAVAMIENCYANRRLSGVSLGCACMSLRGQRVLVTGGTGFTVDGSSRN